MSDRNMIGNSQRKEYDAAFSDPKPEVAIVFPPEESVDSGTDQGQPKPQGA